MMLQNGDVVKALTKKQSKSTCKVVDPLPDKLIFQAIRPVEKYDF